MRADVRRILAASAVLSAWAPAKAEQRPAFPSYDVPAYCAKMSALLGDNPIIRDGCLSNEETAKTKLAKLWADPPVEMETSCLKLMGLGSPNNYQALAGCVSMSVGSQWLDGKLKLAR